MAYARLSTRNNSGLHPNLRGLGSLGDATNPTLTAQAAIQQAVSMYSGQHPNPKDTQGSAWLSLAESEISAGQFDMSVWASTCSGMSAPNLNLLQTASGIGLSATVATTGILASSSVALIPAAAVPVVGWVVAGVGAVVALISTIFQHHAAAVKRDNAFSCSALAAVNNAFQVIAQGVQQGNILPQDAAASLGQIYSEFMSAGGASGSISGPSSIPSSGTAINNHPYCNSNCEMSIVLLGMVLYWQSQYQALAAQQAAEAAAANVPKSSVGGSTLPETTSITPAGGTPSGLSAIPVWGWIALAAFGAWAVM